MTDKIILALGPLFEFNMRNSRASLPGVSSTEFDTGDIRRYEAGLNEFLEALRFRFDQAGFELEVSYLDSGPMVSYRGNSKRARDADRLMKPSAFDFWTRGPSAMQIPVES